MGIRRGTEGNYWVSQTGAETIAEHGLTCYTATKSLAITPGHATSSDIVYRTFDPVATAHWYSNSHSTAQTSGYEERRPPV